jgi:hypothetical protein
VTHEKAVALSADLAAAGISHTLQVGFHEQHAPPVQCRVDLGIPRRYSGGIGEAVRALEEIASRHELVLATSLLGDGLTFSTSDKTPGALLAKTRPV